MSPITVKRCSNKIAYYLNLFGRSHFQKDMLVSLQLGISVPNPLSFDWQRNCYQTPPNKVDLKYLASTHNLIAIYSCVKGTTLCFHREAGNEINEYLIDAGDLNHIVY